MKYVTGWHLPPPTAPNALASFTGKSWLSETGVVLLPLYRSSVRRIADTGESQCTEAPALMVFEEVTTGTETVIQQVITGGRPQDAGVTRDGDDVGAGTAHGRMSLGLMPLFRWAVTVIVWLTGAAAVAAWAEAAPAAEVTSAPPKAIMATAAAASARLNRGTATRPLP